MPGEKISIGIGEFVVADSSSVLESIGLGSCVGVCIWDKRTHLGGLAHIMLGHSNGRGGNPNRFADKAIDTMIDEMIKKGSSTHDLSAKIFGGASLFKTTAFKIGEENVSTVREVLSERGIKILASDVGGDHGRSIWFDTRTGGVVVGSVFGPTKEY